MMSRSIARIEMEKLEDLEEDEEATCSESKGVHYISRHQTHGDAHIEGYCAQKIHFIDVLLEIVGCDISDGGVADPEGVVGEV